MTHSVVSQLPLLQKMPGRYRSNWTMNSLPETLYSNKNVCFNTHIGQNGMPRPSPRVEKNINSFQVLKSWDTACWKNHLTPSCGISGCPISPLHGLWRQKFLSSVFNYKTYEFESCWLPDVICGCFSLNEAITGKLRWRWSNRDGLPGLVSAFPVPLHSSDDILPLCLQCREVFCANKNT